jgi:two-component system LytT family response regulator
MEHLLIVEDDLNIRESLSDLLEIYGFKVSSAKNGNEGFEMIMDIRPDLVLCDVNMPELDGFELLGAINQELKDELIPVFLFLTAKVAKEDIRYGLDLGADDYVLKPFDHQEVLKIIRMRLDKRKKLISSGTPVVPQIKLSLFNKIALPSEDGMVLISFDNIVKCQADRAYCNFYIKDGRKILVSKSMKEFEDILLAHDFLKVHKSTIVNINYITKYINGRGGFLKMEDDSMVIVSVRKKEELMKFIRYES